ncbi:mycorrhiza-induced NACHT/WD-repeat protein [Reticulomyxa filosa]|uniref:Mycorrhiza-induced NACHT/WD-repeat protein n=1 Tax=Reticulomyxa filosa TaxID=46433 RepID=X6PBG9_RETFI|nr:mycorrhiza-induced NACHT/WD-repeat protein [Reticulomyxa filosa]|eukprot:ETO35389.1 mycorrhiza-induced NACHT/WD-repeat protein [Reticulomyxa filosa]
MSKYCGLLHYIYTYTYIYMQIYLLLVADNGLDTYCFLSRAAQSETFVPLTNLVHFRNILNNVNKKSTHKRNTNNMEKGILKTANKLNHSMDIRLLSYDKTIRFWDFKHDRQLKLFNNHTQWTSGIEFSSFSSGRYLCAGSGDSTVRLWDVETSKSLHVFDGHISTVWCVDISPLQSSNNHNKSNNIGVIGGNGYTICSGSYDYTIRIWDIETTKQLILFNGHKDYVMSVKYGSNELIDTVLSGSSDKTVRLWDIRSGKQFKYSMDIWTFSNVICFGSYDKTIRFWDIRSNRKELHVVNRDDKDGGIKCLKFLKLRKNIYLCHGSNNVIFLYFPKKGMRKVEILYLIFVLNICFINGKVTKRKQAKEQKQYIS